MGTLQCIEFKSLYLLSVKEMLISARHLAAAVRHTILPERPQDTDRAVALLYRVRSVKRVRVIGPGPKT